MPKGVPFPLVTVTGYNYVYMQLIQFWHMQVGPHICLFKTHVDIFDHWDASVAEKLRQIADKHSTPFYHPPVAFAPYNAVHGILCNGVHQAPLMLFVKSLAMQLMKSVAAMHEVSRSAIHQMPCI